MFPPEHFSATKALPGCAVLNPGIIPILVIQSGNLKYNDPPKIWRRISMKRTAVRYLRVAFVVAVFALNAFSPVNLLQAQEGKLGNEFDYYSDDTYSCQVGIAIYCPSYTYRSGQETPYVIVSPAGC
jgi:hypothetical protein